MPDIIFNILIYFLAFYGAVVLVITVADSIWFRTRESFPDIRAVLLVKDGGERIEGVVRGMLSREVHRKLMIGEKLTVVDLGSKDETKKILEKLSEEYEELEIIDKADRERILNI